MANYGDVALKLAPDWDRRTLNNQEYGLWIVGHENGVADARLGKEPDKKHQFAWCDVRYGRDVDLNRIRGYRFVKKSEGWEKNEKIWEWDAEGFLVCMGQKLMARDAALYFAEEEQKKRQSGMTDEYSREAERIAREAGIRTEDEEPRRRASRS